MNSGYELGKGSLFGEPKSVNVCVFMRVYTTVTTEAVHHWGTCGQGPSLPSTGGASLP